MHSSNQNLIIRKHSLPMQKSISGFFQATVSNDKTSKTSDLTSKRDKTVIDAVPGLYIIKDFITEAEETCLMQDVYKIPHWESIGHRKRMRLGYKHDPDSKPCMKYLGELPDPIQFVISRILDEKLMSKKPEQCVINEYEAGQGINAHIDRVEDFGSEVAGLSLNSDVIMEFHGPKGEKIELFVPRRSLYKMEGIARYEWKHSIPGRKKDKLSNGTMSIRKKRISLTFRTVELGFRKPKH